MHSKNKECTSANLRWIKITNHNEIWVRGWIFIVKNKLYDAYSKAFLISQKKYGLHRFVVESVLFDTLLQGTLLYYVKSNYASNYQSLVYTIIPRRIPNTIKNMINIILTNLPMWCKLYLLKNANLIKSANKKHQQMKKSILK